MDTIWQQWDADVREEFYKTIVPIIGNWQGEHSIQQLEQIFATGASFGAQALLKSLQKEFIVTKR